MRIRGVVLLAAVLSLSQGTDAVALITPSAVTVDSRAPALKTDGDGWKTAVAVTNVTTDDVKVNVVDVKPAEVDGACDVNVDGKAPAPVTLQAATKSEISISWTAGCHADATGVVFHVQPQVTPVQDAIRIAASKKPADEVDWTVLVAFPVGWFVGLLGLWAAAVISPLAVGLKTPLTYLQTTWSFKDSWASNVTVLGGVLTGVIGSSGPVKAILGEDADTALARATVGVAIAVALVALAAVLLQTTKRDDHFTVGGLVVAGATVVGAAIGELLVVWDTGTQLTLGDVEDWLWIGVILILALLACYSVRNLRATIRAGLTAPKPAMPASAVVAAALVSGARRGTRDVETLLAAIDAAFAAQEEREEVAAETAKVAQEAEKHAGRGVTAEPPTEEEPVAEEVPVAESAPPAETLHPTLPVVRSLSASAAML